MPRISVIERDPNNLAFDPRDRTCRRVTKFGADGAGCFASNPDRPGEPDPACPDRPVCTSGSTGTRGIESHGKSWESGPGAVGQSPVVGFASHAPPDDAQEGDRDGEKPEGRNPVSPDGFETAPGDFVGNDRGGGNGARFSLMQLW